LFRPFGAGRTAKEMLLQCGQFRLLDHAEIMALKIVVANVFLVHGSLVLVTREESQKQRRAARSNYGDCRAVAERDWAAVD
jgi:hypothetical protein